MRVYLAHPTPFLNELPRSDTLFGALCWGIRWIYGESVLLECLQSFITGNPDFLLSSVYPYFSREEKRLHFLPIPLLPITLPPPKNLAGARIFKDYRRIRYVSEGLFRQFLQGTLTPNIILQSLYEEKGEFQVRGPFLLEKSEVWSAGEVLGLFRSQDRARNAINRLSATVHEGAFYFTQEIAVQSGVYFLLKLRNPALKKVIEGALHFLAEKGIGGDVSVGRGHFICELVQEDFLPEPSTATHLVTLALVHPSSVDRRWFGQQRDQLWYQLVKRKGRIESMYIPERQVWKQTVVNLGEGSVFPRDGEREIYGSSPQVHSHPFAIYQNGYAYPVRLVYGHLSS